MMKKVYSALLTFSIVVVLGVGSFALFKFLTDKYYSINSNLSLKMPSEAEINDGYVSFNAAKYSITVDSTIGLCPNDTYGKTCNYEDVSLTNIPTFRIWRNPDGVFALNPQSIQIGKYYLNSLAITKVAPNKVFTDNEISSWENILLNWKVRK